MFVARWIVYVTTLFSIFLALIKLVLNHGIEWFSSRICLWYSSISPSNESHLKCSLQKPPEGNSLTYNSATMIVFSPGYIIVNVICTIIGLATILCNSLAAMLILKKKRHWDNSLTFILHLCIADDLAGVLIIWNVIYNINGHRNFFECVFRSSAISGVIFTSCFVLLGLSVDRYIKITAPFRSAQLENGRWVKVYVRGQWALFFTVCLCVPALTWINHVIPYCDCGFFIVLKREYLLALTSFMTFALLCQCFIYGHVFYIAMSKGNLQYVLYNRHKSIFNGNDKLKVQPIPSRQVLKTTRAVLFVCGLNLLTSLPVGKYLEGHSHEFCLILHFQF